LEENGVLGEIRAQARAAIFKALDDYDATQPTSQEQTLINELIKGMCFL
jgi:hypothetical protein